MAIQDVHLVDSRAYCQVNASRFLCNDLEQVPQAVFSLEFKKEHILPS